jgi:hypothetical protein
MNRRDFSHYGLLTVVALLVMLPSFIFGPGATHSVSFNYVWTSQFGVAMQHGDLYPRWLPASFEGLGSPAFYFYPPLAYWLTGGLDALGLSTPQAINMGGFLLLAASGIAMHVWLSHRKTHPLAGAILYMLLPYHQFDFWVRGAIAEFASFIWLPVIALAIDRLPHRRAICLLALAYGGLLITHLPMAMLAGVFLIAPLVGARVKQNRSILLPAMTGLTLAAGLSCFYLLPALTLQGEISSDLLWSAYYQPSSWTIWQLSFRLLPCMALATIAMAWGTRSVWAGVAVTGSLAALNLIPFLWDIPPLGRVQFPWRVLGIAEFAAITVLMTYRLSFLRAGLIVATAIQPYVSIVGSSIVNMRGHVDYSEMARRVPDAVEYLPVGFDQSLIGEDRLVNLDAYKALPRTTEIDVHRAGRITLHHAAFPIWRVSQDGQEIPTTGPLITFDARPGHYRIERVIIWQEIAGVLLSAFALLVMLILYFGGKSASSNRARRALIWRPRRSVITM